MYARGGSTPPARTSKRPGPKGSGLLLYQNAIRTVAAQERKVSDVSDCSEDSDAIPAEHAFEAIADFAATHPSRATIIEHETAITNLKEAAEVFDLDHGAATYIIEATEGVFAVIASSAVGRIKWRQFGRENGLHQIHLASPETVKEHTGYDVGVVGPLLLGIPSFFDRALLQHDFVYCGAGDAHHTLRIDPTLLEEHNQIVAYFDSAPTA